MATQWLVATEEAFINVYSLPDLQLRHQLRLRGGQPRADSDGVVYIPHRYTVVMVEISNTGKLSVQHVLTIQGRLYQVWSVAIGPQPGQLVVAGGHYSAPAVHIIDIKSDSINQTLELPSKMGSGWHVAALGSGQILVADRDGDLAWYKFVSASAVPLTDTPVGVLIPDNVWPEVPEIGMLGNINQFLVVAHRKSQLFVMDDEGGWHTVDALKGGTGVWLPESVDVAVWQDCVWVADSYGTLVLLCPA